MVVEGLFTHRFAPRQGLALAGRCVRVCPERLRARLPARGRVVWLPVDALLGLGGALFLLGVLAPWFRLVDGRADGDQP